MNKKSIFTCFILLMITLLIAFPNLCLSAAQEGLLLWFNKVLPSLLPFIILVNLLVPLNGLNNIISRVDPLTRWIWHLPGYSFFAFILGLVASYPMGAKTIRNLLQENKLNREDAELTLCFCNNCGPLFIIATVGSAMFNCTDLGYFLLLIHLLSAIILSFFLTNSYQTRSSVTCLNTSLSNTPPFTAIINAGVMNAMDTILCIGGYIIFFSVLLTLTTQTPFLPWMVSRFTHTPATLSYINSLLAGILELSNGTFAFSKFHPISITIIALTSASIGFGGLCVYLQTLYVLDNCLATFRYFLSKCIQALISFSLTVFFYPFYVLYTQKTLLFKWQWLAGSLLLLTLSYWIIQTFVTVKPRSHHFYQFVKI